MLPYVLQLAVIGVAWISLHCVGMCGPLVAGVVAADRNADSEEAGLSEDVARILSYQGGRAVTYAAFGALAGWFGETVDGAIRGVGEFTAVAVGVGLLAVGGWRLLQFRSSSPNDGGSGRVGRGIARAARTLVRLVPAKGRWRIALFGATMGFLPCMLMFWVLGLAASTADPATGAALLVGLVVLTTPVLLAAGASPRLAGGLLGRHRERAVGGALVLSGLWLLLIGAAANGWMGHASWEFALAGRDFRMMFW